MSNPQAAGIDAAVLNFDLMPDSAYVSVGTLAALLDVSDVTIRRRIADGAIPAPVGILGLQRYQVSMVREILSWRDMMSFDDPSGGFDRPLTDANYGKEAGDGN
ncbi:DeoR family transcriptional regulator [Paraburkholderia sp. MPAMCS5]|uniref:helix-turn-helix transcriptional regulator n=1 Tax=Paraburkholderia sp. MPAMCS5 TaxID=3112563 RepID=UPI002E17DFA5|nr:DeoR family transcriptional regulator [Paraburkholderia sp. MPAMCS5]